jgi:hypothetical protein
VSERPYTTAFAASEKLAELVAAGLASEPAVKVSWGYPGEGAPPELVWVGEFQDAEQEARSVGQRRRTEMYEVAVYVDVAMNAAEPEPVNRRIAVLTKAVEAVVHDQPHLGDVLGNDGLAQVAGVDTVVTTMPLTETAYGGVVKVRVSCRARI